MEKMVEFKKLGLSDKTLVALEKKGFEKPSPIQALTIPALLNGDKDIIGQAQTGTGKTAAFSLPILEKMDESKKGVKAIVLAPTRELAIQVADEINSLKGDRRLTVLPVYGGQAMDQQIRALRRGVDIVVGTPGRVQDHIRRKTLVIDNLDFFILDEADEMLNMGFVEDIETILASTNDDKKMLFFSATMPNEILKVAKKYMGEFDVMRVKETLTTNLTEQIYFEVRDGDKFEALCRVADVETDFYGIVFCRTKNDVDGVVSKLIERGYEAEGIHGDISQAQRERTLRKFKTKNISILVATDVAARGIDVNDLTHVINYSIPQEAEAYVHRIGRTGRAGKKGVAITFVTPREMGKLSRIKRVANAEIKKSSIPEVEEVLKAKKESLYACVGEIIAEKDFSVYSEMATELTVEGNNPLDVIAALLRHVYDDEFDKETYRKIRNNMGSNDRRDRNDRNDRGDRRDRNDRNSRNDRNGRSDRSDRSDRGDRPERPERGGRQTLDNQTRLFIGMGKKDDLDAKKLLEIVNKEAKVPGRKIKDIKIMNEFSFMTVPYSEAEDIIHALNATRKGGRPLVEKAKN